MGVSLVGNFEKCKLLKAFVILKYTRVIVLLVHATVIYISICLCVSVHALMKQIN